MRQLFAAARKELQSGSDVVVATVINSSGSVPREAGAHMLIGASGRIGGTVGGGAVEYACIVRGQEMISGDGGKDSFAKPYFLRKNEREDLGMICGGDVVIYFSYLEASEKNRLLLQKIEELYEKNEDSWLIIDITQGSGGSLYLWGKQSGAFGGELSPEVVEALKNKPCRIQAGGKEYYGEGLINPSRVFIFGGGHVSQSLVPVLVKLNFRCIVLEDREEFTDPALFPGAEETKLIDNERIHDFIDIRKEDYICIMTRGHKADTIVQAQAIRSAAHYIGVIGSARKVEGVRAKLREMGFSDREMSRVTTPIGLPILAETPDEIAISIAAQLILDRAGRE